MYYTWIEILFKLMHLPGIITLCMVVGGREIKPQHLATTNLGMHPTIGGLSLTISLTFNSLAEACMFTATQHGSYTQLQNLDILTFVQHLQLQGDMTKK